MARRPNYAFERNERAKLKAAKKLAKREAKLAAKQPKIEDPCAPCAPAETDTED